MSGYASLTRPTLTEILEDDISITKTVRSSQVGGALVGGLVLGGVGAVVGGLSGKKQTSRQVKRVRLHLNVNDIKNPLHDICFLNMDKAIKKDGFIYQKVIERARHWHGLIEVLIKRADEEAKASATVTNETSYQSLSIADEIKKLAELRDSGLLSLEEFQKQKVKLLDS